VYSALISSCSIKINEKISEVFISESVGIIDMVGVAGLGKMKFDNECMLYFDKNASYNGEGLLHIENYTFKNDVMFSEDVKTVYLKRVKTISNA
ncbi:putative LRR containing protein, partial [Trachipleistophora hominis]